MRAADGRAPALSIRNLSVRYDTVHGPVHAVDDVSLDVWPGETVGLVGESGCGKTATALAALGLLPRPAGRVTAGRVLVGGRDLLTLGRRELQKVRGAEVAMIFQDPMSALHPAQSILAQVTEAVRVHAVDLSASAARERAVALLDLVGVPDARTRARSYPHEWSGGMRQRAMIAMAVAHRPRVLIADEPTTALDVTVQAQVLELLRRLQDEHELAIVLISHDLGVIAEMADRVAVMYAGRVVESATASALFACPRHPYTAGLLASLPRLDREGGAPRGHSRLTSESGRPAVRLPLPPRCALGQDREGCMADVPRLRPTGGAGHQAACHHAEELGAGPGHRLVEADLRR